MIKLQKLNKNYITPDSTITALDDINLHVLPGEIFGIIGKSGAGKSTLIRCVNLLEQPTSGQIIVNGEDLTTLTPGELRRARRKIGMIFQHFNLLSSRTVYDNIAFPLELSSLSTQEMKNKIMPLLELTGLMDKRNHYPAQLSGGQKQRVAIARALASEPQVLLCDEATSALDPETTNSILQLLRDIRDKLNIAILLITHEMSVIKACCDRVGILENGKLIEENEVGEFFAYPKTETAKNFIFSSLSQTLAPTLQQHLLATANENTHPVLRLWFLPDTANQPIISQLITQFGLRINILQGNVEYIKKHAMGIMLVAIDGEKNQLQAGIDHLKRIGVNAEIIGHVTNDIISFI
ncbi:MAG: methionine ABC transporter ATP-binding protein [Gammaproteobacteria bacterium]|nr:methionine ABC transporter ATP-binding protein [Gammaproteobacteria bacterium]